MAGVATRVLIMVGMLVAGCAASDPENALRARIAAAAAAAEARDTGFFRDLIAPGFQDQRGNDRQSLVNMIRGQFLINQRVEVISRIESITILGDDAARTVIAAGLVGASGKPLALGGISADLYRIRLEWVRNGKDWQVIGARWSGLGAD
jgi:hypothetical protein